MCIRDFNLLSLDDKIALVNNRESRLLESRLCIGKYKANLYEMEGIKVHVVFNSLNKNVLLVNALEDSELDYKTGLN